MVNVLGTEFADLDFINFRWVGWYFCSLYFLAHRCLKKKKTRKERWTKRKNAKWKKIPLCWYGNIWQSKGKSWLRLFVMYLPNSCIGAEEDYFVFISYWEFVVVDSSVVAGFVQSLLLSSSHCTLISGSSNPTLRMALQCCNPTSLKWQELQHFYAQK